jgi:hypothetical protein
MPKAPALIAGGLGLVLAVPLLAVLALLVVTPVTRSGAGYLQGALDERMTAPGARQAAAQIGGAAQYVELDADHFLIVKQTEAVQAALGAWLAAQEAAHEP